MRLVIQRVASASVTVENKIVGEITKGLLVLTGFEHSDSNVDLKQVATKLIEMRIFPNQAGRFDLSVKDINGEILLVPQFTLFADTTKGRRPDFFGAMEPKLASQKFDEFVKEVKTNSNLKVAQGIFGADMQVNLCNDGPVTIIYDSNI
jgi:D-tyrosyl-tRNA(Tyr) deacylase